MKKIYIVKTGSANRYSHFHFAFTSLEEAEKCLDYCDKKISRGDAAAHFGQINEMILMDSFDEMKIKEYEMSDRELFKKGFDWAIEVVFKVLEMADYDDTPEKIKNAIEEEIDHLSISP